DSTPRQNDSPPPKHDAPALAIEAEIGRLIRQSELFERLAVSKSTGHRLIASRKIGPRPIRLGGGVRYHLAEVTSWLGNRRPDGDVHDATTWPAIYASLRRREGGRR